MRFPGTAVTGVAAMLLAIIDDGEVRWRERLLQTTGDFGGNRAGDSIRHGAFIGIPAGDTRGGKLKASSAAE